MKNAIRNFLKTVFEMQIFHTVTEMNHSLQSLVHPLFSDAQRCSDEIYHKVYLSRGAFFIHEIAVQ